MYIFINTKICLLIENYKIIITDILQSISYRGKKSISTTNLWLCSFNSQVLNKAYTTAEQSGQGD